MSRDYCTDPECDCGSYKFTKTQLLEKELRRAKRAFRAALRVLRPGFNDLTKQAQDMDIVDKFEEHLSRRAKE
jgi:hypothetical protein